MRIFTEKEFELFSQLAKLTQKGLHQMMATYLRKMYGEENTTSTKNYVYAEGNIPIALVSHMDTVHSVPPKLIYFDRDQDGIWSPDGLGADDRAGIFAIIKIIESGLRPHIICTTDEEVGCIGALMLSKKPCPFKELNYIIELDRRGKNDCVFYECNNPNFEEYINQFGFETDWGTFSDISQLCPSWKIAGVNLSVGYFNEHSYSEMLCSEFLLDTIDKVKNMLLEEEIPKFEYIPYYNIYRRGRHSSLLKEYAYAYGYEFPNEFEIQCSGCKNVFYEEETFPVKSLDGGTKFYCPDCICSNIEWCSLCQEPFEIDPKNPESLYCPDCCEKFFKGGVPLL